MGRRGERGRAHLVGLMQPPACGCIHVEPSRDSARPARWRTNRCCPDRSHRAPKASGQGRRTEELRDRSDHLATTASRRQARHGVAPGRPVGANFQLHARIICHVTTAIGSDRRADRVRPVRMRRRLLAASPHDGWASCRRDVSRLRLISSGRAVRAVIRPAWRGCSCAPGRAPGCGPGWEWRSGRRASSRSGRG